MSKREENVLKEYERYLRLKGLSSFSDYLSSLREYFDYLAEQRLPYDRVDPGTAEEYRAHLLMCGKNLSAGTVNNKLNRLRSFYHFLHKKRRIHSNPFDWVEAVRGAKSLPKNILSVEDMGKLLDRFAVKRDMDLMMRSVVEFLYGSALRISEVCALKEKGIDFDRGMLLITDFKNHEERRQCPATEVSLKVLRRYMRYSREKLVGESEREKGYLYPQRRKTTIRCLLNRKLRAECKRLGLKEITTHSFRHSAATHLLRAGAGIREVQAFLGHCKITTTERYTRVVKEDLKAVIAHCHPREREPAE